MSDSIPAQPLVDMDPAEQHAQLTRELHKQVREPFKRALQRLLKFRPSDKALQDFANKSPDRWAQAVSILGNLSGYQQGVNVSLTIQNVGDMSDAALLAEYRAQAERLAKVAALARGAQGEVVDAEVIHSSPVALAAPVTKGE